MSDTWSSNRIGEVVAIDAAKCRVKVHFEEMDDYTSDWLPVLQFGTGNVKHYWLPSVGEQVVCVFNSDGSEEGFVIGSYYPEGAYPPESGAQMRFVKFPDGSLVRWNNGVLTVIAINGVNITANVVITGNLNISGNLVVGGSINSGPITSSGIVTAAGFVTA